MCLAAPRRPGSCCAPPGTQPPPATPTRLVLTLPPPIIRPTVRVIPTRIQVAVLPVDGSDGNQNLRNNRGVKSGRNVLIPGGVPYGDGDTAVFRDRVVFQVEVFDRTAGQRDGAGIESVTFTITDETGQEVHTRTEKTPGFCVFGGGEPDCTVWRFSEHGGQWPGGAPLQPGVHDVRISSSRRLARRSPGSGASASRDEQREAPAFANEDGSLSNFCPGGPAT